MAIALFKAISGIGLKTTAFLQSLFLFPFGALLQGMNRFSNSGGPSNQPPALPCSTTASVSPRSTKIYHDIDVDREHEATGNGSDMRTTSSSPAAGSAPQDHNKGPASQCRIPPGHPPAASATKENCPPPKASPTDIDAQGISNGLSRLDLNGTGQTTGSGLTSHHPAMENGTGGVTVTEDRSGGAEVVSAGGGGAAAHERGRPAPADGRFGGIVGIVGGEVTRAPPVPLRHSISQTRKLKETMTIQLGGSETVQIQAKLETPEQAAERAMHSRFMRDALDMARLALKTNETPVGCVLVYKGRVIAKGMNATNVTRNGTRHAELMAICALLSYSPTSDLESTQNNSQRRGTAARVPLSDKTNEAQSDETSSWGDVDPSDGHLYPYGQKLHPSPRVDPSVITECTLYVTVEPCVMCASLLRQLGIKKVYFGAVNDKFGGTGGVFRIHQNSPYSMASAPPSPGPQNGNKLARPVLEPRPASTDGLTDGKASAGENDCDVNVSAPLEPAVLPGDGGNVEPGFEAEGGWGRDEAVTLLRQFYVQENNRAPVPRKKEGRAARLAAMLERDGHAGGPMIPSDAFDMQKGQSSVATSTSEGYDPTTESATESTTS